MKTIKQLEKEPIHGNHFHDSKLLNDCHKIILSDSPITDKMRALQLISKIMGGEEKVSNADVRKYITFASSL